MENIEYGKYAAQLFISNYINFCKQNDYLFISNNSSRQYFFKT